MKWQYGKPHLKLKRTQIHNIILKRTTGHNILIFPVNFSLTTHLIIYIVYAIVYMDV